MMKIKTATGRNGFTLIETLMAMAIFTIGILGLFGMQASAIKENLAANSITSGSTWAADQVERLIGLDYNHTDLGDTDGDGCGGMNDTGAAADGSAVSGPDEPVYNIYWNVAGDCILVNIPNAGDPTEEQKPKYLRIIVTANKGGDEEERAVFNYIKQNV